MNERIPPCCQECGKTLVNDADRYGHVGSEVCYECWLLQAPVPDSWFGLAPHRHDLRNGTYIGSTVMEELPDDRTIEVAPGLYFTPDSEDATFGIWEDWRGVWGANHG